MDSDDYVKDQYSDLDTLRIEIQKQREYLFFVNLFFYPFLISTAIASIFILDTPIFRFFIPIVLVLFIGYIIFYMLNRKKINDFHKQYKTESENINNFYKNKSSTTNK